MAIATFVSVTALFTQDRQKPAYLSLDFASATASGNFHPPHDG
jgi:hypothetical protein